MFSNRQALNIPGHETMQEMDHHHSVDRQTEALFAAELARLSIQERDESLFDVHGVSDVQEEKVDFVQRCFEDLEEAISLIPPMDQMAYRRARHVNESYVCNPDFLLPFLRACSFDINAAASRIISFFEAKLELFGPEKMVKDITYDDLDEDDILCLESGYMQVLPGRDLAGRAILVLMPIIRKYRTLRNRQRAAYMMVMHAIRDPETQQKGFVGIAYNVGTGHSQDRQAVWKMARLFGALPTKFRGMHYCYDDANVKLLFTVAMYVWERQIRIRCRLHFGTPMECLYNLMTFGIPANVLPVNFSGELKLEAHQEYCRKLRNFPRLEDKTQRIGVPGTYDILLGRGKPLQKHSGNLRYHNVIDAFHGQYEKASKSEKTNLSKLIVTKMKEEGGRFLKQDDFGWIEIDDDVARYKVSHTFRNHRLAARTGDKQSKEKETENANSGARVRKPEKTADNGQKTSESDDIFRVGEKPKRRRLSDSSRVSGWS